MATKIVKGKKNNSKAVSNKRVKGLPVFTDEWDEIPTRGQLFTLAIAAWRGAQFEFPQSREEAKETIVELDKEGFIQRKG